MSSAATPLSILVADDDAVSRLLVSSMLRQLGHQVDTAIDGLEAVEAAARTDYDVVLLDLQMPEVDGFEALRRIRSRREGHVRIVAMTSTLDDATRAACAAEGFDEVAQKPLSMDVVARLISAAPPPSDAGRAQATPVGVTTAVSGIDEAIDDTAFDRFRDDVAAHSHRSIAEMLGTVIEGIRAHVDAMASAAGRGDQGEVGRGAHSVRGAAAMIGAARLAAHAAEIERTADSVERDELLRTIAVLVQDLAVLQSELSRRATNAG